MCIDPTDGLLGLNQDGDVVLTTENDQELKQPTPPASDDETANEAMNGGMYFFLFIRIVS